MNTLPLDSFINCLRKISKVLGTKGLVTNYGEGGGATKREGGGAREVLPLR